MKNSILSPLLATASSMTLAEYDAITRRDLAMFVERVFVELTGETYIDNFHIHALCAELAKLLQPEWRRLAVAVPPRSLKSIIISVALPAWLLGHNPRLKIICASYGQGLAEQLSNDTRLIMQTDWYKRLFPNTRLARGRQAIDRFQTTLGGARQATSVGGSLTGFGADIFIVDDPMKPEEALSEAERLTANHWIKHTMATRLNDKAKGRMVLVMQRLHEDDAFGNVVATSGFTPLVFPAIADADYTYRIETPFGAYTHHWREGEPLQPEREPLEVLDQLRRDMGSYFFAAQYLQNPAPLGGGLVKIEWFQRYSPGVTPHFDRIIQSWDTASKATELNDYSVCVTLGVTRANTIYILHVFRDRLEYPDLKRKVIEHARAWNAGVVVVEDTASGIQLHQELRSAGNWVLHKSRPKGDKVLRMQAQTAAIEDGRVFLPSQAAWLDTYERELALFPKAKFDDQVDATAQGLAFILMPTGFDNMVEWARRLAYEADESELLRIAGPSGTLYRLTHPDPATSVRTSADRQPRRMPDGTFLVAEGELHSVINLPGISIVEVINGGFSELDKD